MIAINTFIEENFRDRSSPIDAITSLDETNLDQFGKLWLHEHCSFQKGAQRRETITQRRKRSGAPQP